MPEKQEKSIDQWELHGNVKVADMQVFYGLEAGQAVYRVAIDHEGGGVSLSEMVELPPHALQAILTLCIFGDNIPGAQFMYIVAEQYMPANKCLRPIP